MISFTYVEILRSVVCAVIFGSGCALVESLIYMLCKSIKDIKNVVRDILEYDKILIIQKRIIGSKGDSKVKISPLIFVPLFAVGFMTLSYYSLDGQVRLYMLAITSASLFLLKNTFFRFLMMVYRCLFDVLYWFIVVILRVFLFPFVYAIRKKRFKN